MKKLAAKIVLAVIVSLLLCSCGLKNSYVSIQAPTIDLPSNYSESLTKYTTIYIEKLEDCRRVARVDPKILFHKGSETRRQSALYINDKEIATLITESVKSVCEKIGYDLSNSSDADLILSTKLLELELSGVAVGGGFGGEHIICSLEAVLKFEDNQNKNRWCEVIKAYGVKKNATTGLWPEKKVAVNSAMEDLIKKIATTIYDYQTEYCEKWLRNGKRS